MNSFILIIALLGLSFYAYFSGSRMLRAVVLHQDEKQHSRDYYHGLYLALMVFFPAFLLFVFWKIFSNRVIDFLLKMRLQSIEIMSKNDLTVMMWKLKAVLQDGLALNTLDIRFQDMITYAHHLESMSKILLSVLMLSVALIFLYFKRQKISHRFMARHHVERVVNYLLIAASVVAILNDDWHYFIFIV